MKHFETLFRQSPFSRIAEHARKIHQCVELVKPVADAILTHRMDVIADLQTQLATHEHEADQIKDITRQQMPGRLFLPFGRREALLYILRQLDRMGDKAEDFAVVATFRLMHMHPDLHMPFLQLVELVVRLSETLLTLAERLAALQQDSFEGPDAAEVLVRIEGVSRMERESDQMSRELARRYYGLPSPDPVMILGDVLLFL